MSNSVSYLFLMPIYFKCDRATPRQGRDRIFLRKFISIIQIAIARTFKNYLSKRSLNLLK
jgi:hypothetical protein